MTTTLFYFNSRNPGEQWAGNPQNMVDGDSDTYAACSTDDQVQALITNTCVGEYLGIISKVEIGVHGNTVNDDELIVRPVFGGTTDCDGSYVHNPDNVGITTHWDDITADANGPITWSWNDIVDLDCDLEYQQVGGFAAQTIVSIVYIRVTHTPVGDGDLDIYFSGSHLVRGWCKRWQQINYDVVIETFLEKDLIQYIVDYTIPGAVGEWKIATRGSKFYDGTWKGENTLHFSSNMKTGSNLRFVRNDIDVFVDDIRTEPVKNTTEYVNMKIQGKISGSVFL